MSVSSRQPFVFSSEKVSLLKRLLKKGKEPLSSLVAMPRAESFTDFPLSSGQQRFWFLDQLEPGSSAYLMADAMRLLGPLDVHVLERCFHELMQRHESLRTTFVSKDGQPVQRIHPLQPFHLPISDLRSCPEDERDQEMMRHVIAYAQRPFDLSQGPLLRIGVWQLGEQEHVLVVVLHHIISDGWSIDVLRRELAMLYTAFRADQSSPLPALPIQYADYAVWQCNQLLGENMKKQLAYWKEQLADLPPVLQLPLSKPRPPVQSYRGTNYGFVVAENIAQGLKQLSLGEGVTLFLTLFATFVVLLTRYTGQEDIIVGTPIANRSRAEVEGVIGLFTNTLAMRCDLSGNPPFREIVRRLREVALDAYEHQDVPWEQIVEIAQPERDLSYPPLFQVMFALDDVATTSIELEGLSIQPLPNGDATSKFDLSLSFREEASTLMGCIEYNTDLFDAEGITRISEWYQVLLAGIVADPQCPIRQLPLLSEEERQTLLVKWNNPQPAFSSCQSVQELFEAQVRRRPQSAAIMDALSYGELNRRANQLAWYLQRQGVGPETVVGLCLSRSAEMLVCLLAILKAGGAYLPLDPAHPSERLHFMITDAQASLVVTTREAEVPLQGETVPLLVLDEIRQELVDEVEDNPACRVVPTTLAYIIYTSGSTGRPKGVAITQGALAQHCQVIARAYALSEEDAVLQLASLNFDLAAEEIFPTLVSGARIVPCPSVALSDFATFSRFVERNNLSVLNLSASYWQAWTMALERGEAFLPASVRLVIAGNEAVQREHLQLWQRLVGSGTCWYNAYGVTEATITTALYQPDSTQYVPISQSTGVPIGRPLEHTQVYVLDAYFQPVPIGVPGELYIGGSGLARGYLHQPKLAAERFIPHPFSERAGVRYNRTGDQVRYRPDGQLEYLGRIDQQVKLRGFRIELGEIESVLQLYESIGQAVVVVHEGRPGEKRLIAYVVAKEKSVMSTRDIQSFLETKLPQYMQPSAVVILEELPMTANGKLDRRALAALPLPVEGQQGQGPRTPIEEIIAGIWSQVLGQEYSDIDANFFALGGHSLLIMQVAARLNQSLGTALPLRRFFEQPTIRGLAQAIEEQKQEFGLKSAFIPLEPVSREEPLPLSFAQQRLWFLDQLEPGNVSYTIPEVLRLRGKLNLHALERSFNEIVRRHEILRTSFELVEGVPYQRIWPPSYFTLPVQDLSQSEASEQELQRILAQEMQKPFDLTRGPFLRVKALRLSVEEHILVIHQHHIISDGWSAGIMSGELSTLYRAYCAREPSPLVPLAIQYADYAVWQRRWLQGEVLESQLSYWKQHLAGVSMVLDLPTDRRRPAVQSFRGAGLAVELSTQQIEGFKRLSRDEGATLFMTLLTTFMTLLARLSGQDEILVGTPIANRNRAEIEPLIGFFVNTLVLRGNLVGNPGFRELLRRVREEALSAYSHQDVPFEQVVEAIQPQRDLSRSPLFQVMFSLQSSTGAEVELAGVNIEPVIAESKTTKFDLTLMLEESPAGLRGTLEYNSDIFEAATMSDWLDSYVFLLDQIVANPDQRLGDFSLLPAAQRQIVLEQWNATRTAYPADMPVHRLFELQVARTPDVLAVRFADQSLSYEALNQRANQLAHALQQLGVRAETRVGLCLESSIDMVVAVLAVLKAGGAYLPLDVAWPDERYLFMCEDAGLNIILTSRRLRQRFSGVGQMGQLICLDEDEQHHRLEQQPQSNPLSVHHPDQLAYLIYTSGSTGVPKGVMIPHRGLVNYLHWGLQRYRVAEGNGSLVHSSLSFDLTVTSLFLPLLVGGTVALLPEEQQLEALGEAVREASVGSLVKITPAHLGIINAQFVGKHLESRSGVVVIGGEQLYREHLAAWQEQAPEILFINEYGPTETVVGCCVYQVPAEQEGAGPIPIGRPIANTQIYLLDRWGQPVPRGAVGELYIAGAGLARGYLHRPGLTAERFIPDPFSEQPGERLYRTGDLARYQPDGTLEFLGRNDSQVKVRGYRIELGEIEHVLRQHSMIKDCAVLLHEDQQQEKRLVAYVVMKQDKESENAKLELRSMLQQQLPPYMVPTALYPLSALPLNSNGKVDQQVLHAHMQQHQPGESSAARSGPRDRVELQLAQIWEELLPGAAQAGVSITDDFFESGGHSLLAMRLMAHIQEEFGLHLPLAALFQGASIEQLAHRLRQERQDGAISALVPIQRGQHGHPFFCVHPIGGEVLCYLELARALGKEQAVSGLQAVGLYGEQDPYDSIEAMADHYIQLVRTQQPEGPYALGGWSMGGVIAFEMARKLREEGQEIACLVLFDSSVPTPSSQHGHEDSQEEVLQFVEDIANLLGIEEECSSLQLEDSLAEEQMERFLGLLCQHHLLPKDSGPSSLWHRLRVFQANSQALRSYRPQGYPGHLHLFRASEQIAEREHDLAAGWSDLVRGGIDVHILPGNHYTLMRKPGAQALAEQIRMHLK